MVKIINVSAWMFLLNTGIKKHFLITFFSESTNYNNLLWLGGSKLHSKL